MLLHNLYINVTIAVILLYSKSLYDLPKPRYQNKANFILRRANKPFFANISKTIHFRAYVASQVEYKCGHCECFAVSEKSLRPSQAEIQNYPNTRLKWNMGVAPLDSY